MEVLYRVDTSPVCAKQFLSALQGCTWHFLIDSAVTAGTEVRSAVHPEEEWYISCAPPLRLGTDTVHRQQWQVWCTCPFGAFAPCTEPVHAMAATMVAPPKGKDWE